ncbi:hypothetical protein BTHI11S_03985 [Bosea thiooxidans]
MKIFRIVVGLLLLVGGLYVLIGEHFAGTSADATVNARINVIRAPIEGQVNLAVRSIGARVNAGELVADITDERFDTARLIDLERDRDNQQIELKRVATQKGGDRKGPRRLCSAARQLPEWARQPDRSTDRRSEGQSGRCGSPPARGRRRPQAR